MLIEAALTGRIAAQFPQALTCLGEKQRILRLAEHGWKPEDKSDWLDDHGRPEAARQAAHAHPFVGGRRNQTGRAAGDIGQHFRSHPLPRRTAPRGAAAAVGATDRHARRIVSALTDHGVPLRLVSRVVLATRWMPDLFTDALTR
jgi:hypothetical protein